MTPVELLLSRLSGKKKTGKGWSAKCPAHGDRKASLSVSEGDDGRALVKCHAGCEFEAIVVAAGLTPSDSMPAPDGKSSTRKPRGKSEPNAKVFMTASKVVTALEAKLGKRSGLWTYHDAAGKPCGLVVRWDRADGKMILPVSRHGNSWSNTGMPDPRPLYALSELSKATTIVLTEGEKAADAARTLGFVATTTAGGCEAADKTDLGPLSDKEVWILPDNDSPGRKYADKVAERLLSLGPKTTVRIVELPGLPEKGDIVDWIEAQGPGADPGILRERIETLASAAEPRHPADAGDRAFVPFPVEVLPVPIREFVIAGALSIGCDPSYLALPLLVSLAAAIGNSRRLELKHGWLVPAIHWGAVIGESGTAKTPAFNVAMKAVRERQRLAMDRHKLAMKRYEIDLARWEKEMAGWKRNGKAVDPPPKPEPPKCERFVVSDATVEALTPILGENPRGLLSARDELAGWIGSFDRYAAKGKPGTDAAHWLSMHNGGGFVSDRKTGTPRTIDVPHAVVSVIGGIQPGILLRVLGQEHRESGLAARLLVTWPPRKAKLWTDESIDPSLEKAVAGVVNRLYELQPTLGDAGEPQPILITMSPAAKKAYVEFFNHHNCEQLGMTGDIAAAWSKLEEYAARLALVIHCARWAADDPTLASVESLDIQSMEAGIRLAEWFKSEAKRVYAMLDETQGESDRRRLVEWILRKGGSTTAREVQQGCRWLKSSGTAEVALNELKQTGRGRWEEVPTSASGGQPTRKFRLS